MAEGVPCITKFKEAFPGIAKYLEKKAGVPYSEKEVGGGEAWVRAIKEHQKENIENLKSIYSQLGIEPYAKIKQQADNADQQSQQQAEEKSKPVEQVVEDSGGAGKKPPVEEQKVAAGGEGVELSFEGLQDVANEFGLENVQSRERKSDSTLLSNANDIIRDWVSKGSYSKNIEKLLTGVENRELNLLDEQRLILQQHLANEVSILKGITDKSSPEFDRQLAYIKRLKDVGQIARQESGAALRIPIGMASHPVKDYGDAMVAMQEAIGEGKEMTAEQKTEVEKYVLDYEAKLKIAEDKVLAAEAKFSELQAQGKVQESASKAKKTSKDYGAERKQIISDIREKLKKARGDTSVTAVPYAKELIAISPDVAKLVKSLVEQGVSKLEDIVSEIHATLKADISDIKESDVVDMIAGRYDVKKETKGDLEKKLKGIVNKKSEEAVKIYAKIKAGDFEKAEKVVSWVDSREMKSKFPKLYNEALDAIDAKDQAQLDFDVALFKKQQANRSGTQKGIDLVRSMIATTKAVKSGIDDSAVMMQNIVAMIAHPRSAAKALKEHALDAVSEKRFRRYLTELHNSSLWPLIEKSGLDITDPKSLNEQNKEEIFDNNLLNKDFKIKGKKYNIGKYATRPFERAFTSLGNAMRVNMFARIAEREYAKANPRTFESDPDFYKSLATMLNTQTGRGKLHTQVQRASQLITSGIWSPRLMASRLNMLGLSELAPLYGGKGYYKGLTPEVRKMALLDMAKFLGAGVSVMLFAGSMGAGIDDDPESPTFGTIKIGNKTYNAWGGFTPYAKTIYQGITGHRKIGGERKSVTRSELLGNFLRSRLTPAASVATDLLSGKDYSKKPVTLEGELTNLAMPLSISAIIDAVKKDGITGILTQGVPSFIGVGVSDERDYEKPQTIKNATIQEDFKRTEDKGFMPPEVNKSISHDGVSLKLTDEQYDFFDKEVTEQRQKLVDKYFTDNEDPKSLQYKRYSKKSDAQRKATLEMLYSEGRDAAKEAMLKKYPELEEEAKLKNKEQKELSDKQKTERKNN